MKGLFRRRREKEVTAVKVYSFFYLAGLAFSVWLFFNVDDHRNSCKSSDTAETICLIR